MLSLSLFCLLALRCIAVAYPVGRQKRSIPCLVQTDIFRGDRTACDGGQLQKMSDVKREAAATRPGVAYGADNMADVILSRLGIFDYDKWNLDGMNICIKHKKELGSEWEAHGNNRPKMSQRDNQPRCNVPSIEGFPAQHQTNRPLIGSYRLSKEQSKAIFTQKHRLVPIGAGKKMMFNDICDCI